MLVRMGLIIAVASVWVAGCASPQPTKAISPEARKELQVRRYSSFSADTVQKAVESVLNDEGGKIRVSDLDGGIVIAELEKPPAPNKSNYPGAIFWKHLLAKTQAPDPEDTYELAVNIDRSKLSEVVTKVSFQRITRNRLGVLEGEEILAPKVYIAFFEQLQLELDGSRKATDTPAPTTEQKPASEKKS